MKAVCEKHHAAYEVSTGCPDCVTPLANSNGDAFPDLASDELWMHLGGLRLSEEELALTAAYRKAYAKLSGK